MGAPPLRSSCVRLQASKTLEMGADLIFAVTDEQRLIADSLRRFLREMNGFESRQSRLRAAVPDRRDVGKTRR